MSIDINYIKSFVDARLSKINHLKLEYIFLSGSSLYGADKASSDIDLNFVFKDNFFSKKKMAITKIDELINSVYLPLHEKFQRQPDPIYPGEYISVSQILASINGGGFTVVNNELNLVETFHGYWESSEQTWYRAWLGAIAFSEEITKHSNEYAIHKTKAQLDCIVYLILKNVQLKESFNLDQLINKLYQYKDKQSSPFGLTDKYTKFKLLHTKTIQKTIKLNSQLFSEIENGIYTVNKIELSKEVQRLVTYAKSFEIDIIPASSRLNLEETYSLSLES